MFNEDGTEVTDREFEVGDRIRIKDNDKIYIVKAWEKESPDSDYTYDIESEDGCIVYRNVFCKSHDFSLVEPTNEKDLGSHYRHEFQGHKIDVYRVLQIFRVTDPVAQHIVKKLLRGSKKGHTMDFVWNEVKQAVERKFEMMEEGK